MGNLRPDALQRQREQLARTAEKAVRDILTIDQLKRLQEISLQQRGPQALSDPEIAEALKLTASQKDKIKRINEEATQEAATAMQGLFQFTGDFQRMQKDFVELNEKMGELRKLTDEKLMDALTSEQRTKWRELSGEVVREKSR